MASLASIRETFFEECEDLLAALADGLAAMDAGARDTETVNAVFRAVHSIKGGAGAFALADLVSFTHRFETVLDSIRSGALLPSAQVMHVLQRSADHLFTLVDAARNETSADTAQTERLLAQLETCLGPAPVAKDEDFSFEAVPLQIDLASDADANGSKGVVITFRPHAALFANGHDPALLIASLTEFGRTEAEIDLSLLPDFDSLHPDTPYLAWTIRFWSVAPETAVAEVFEFVDGLCDLHVTSLDEPNDPAPLPPFRPIEAEPAAAPPTPVPPPAEPQISAPPAGDARNPQPTLRVALERVDRLINAVGELIINQAMLAQSVQETASASDARLSGHVEDYRLLARDIQEAVMAIRAQPVKPLFQRMSRIVREASESTGKPVRLATAGDSTEVDKTLIEQLSDPLTHMLRNAVDHGIEPPETRRATGKDPCGTIRLTAAHRSGNVLLTIGDDGAGLNRPKILEIARRKGLVNPAAELSEPEIDALLFLPGFSTSQSVSNLSGRGVGLDVVKNAVTALGGRIGIASIPGRGTEFTLSLPLTLAVMDGMLITVAGQTLVVPTSAIVETIRPQPEDLHAVGPSETLLKIRGRFIPMVDVAACLGFPRTEPQVGPLLLLVETDNQSQCALIVDAVLQQRQVVIKGLNLNHGAVPGVSAATVLGDGRIALILDSDALAATRGPLRFSRTTQPLIAEGADHAG